MTAIRLHGDLSDLTADLREIATTTKPKLQRVVDYNAREGNKIAQAFAKESAGSHGVHYPKAFSAERIAPLENEYGPDSSKPQGDMSFEFGSRNQKPHLDLARSADVIAPRLERDVAKLAADLFWPGAK